MSLLKNKFLTSFVLHYSDSHDSEVNSMLRSETILSEAATKRLLSFMRSFIKESVQDKKEGKMVLGEKVGIYSTEKAILAILNIFSANNLDYLVDEWFKCQ